MDSVLNYRKHLLLAGVLFTLHNTEEAFGFSRFAYPPHILSPIPTTAGMIAAIAIITVIVWGILLWAYWQPNQSIKRNILSIVSAVFLFNAFIPHIVEAIVLQRYFPGVVTATLLFLPFSLWILPKLYRAFPNRSLFYRVVSTGLLLTLLLMLLLQGISKLIWG